MKKLLLSLALISCSAGVHAEFPVGKVGINLTPKVDVDIPNASGDGNGFGFYGDVGGDMFFVYVDYQASNLEIDSIDLDLKETRIGGGIRNTNGNASLLVRVENYKQDADGEDDSGIGVHIGGDYAFTDSIGMFGDIGLLSLDESDGTEFRVGVRGKLTDMSEVYGAYRNLQLDDSGEELELSDIRLGVNVLF
ncbi:MAG: hypothetical protein P1U67_08965 [Alcanivoracaceae bacterium]|nr:hypothetical protein [Alcanivoracaceae bacterium]